MCACGCLGGAEANLVYRVARMLNHSFHTPRIGVGRILIGGARDLLSSGVRMDRFSDANGNTELVTSTRYLQVTEDRCTKGRQNPVPQPTVCLYRRPQTVLPAHKKTLVLQGFVIEWRIGDSNP